MKIYSFTGGRPSPEDFPIQGLIDATQRMLRRRGTDLIAYPDMNGQHDELAEIVAIRFENRECKPLPKKNIIISAGSMMAIEELARFLTQPGDTIITEELSYMGSLGCFRSIGLEIKGIPVHPIQGMDMDILEDTIKGLVANNIKPKFIYTIPTYQNPTGSILTLERRRRMIELGREYRINIIEDDCYGDIHFEAPLPPPNLYTLSQFKGVAYVGSFSKIIGPGLRLGYMCIPDELEKIVQRRIGMKVSGLASLIVAEYLRDNLKSHIKRHNEVIKEKRDVLLKTLETELGDCVTWDKPRGGLFVWLKLPDSIDMAKLQELSEQNGVIFTSGKEFHYNREEIKY
ncbi:PLP-dependent aminotransferase family protein, partial [Candidatus Poribacteria bacterium]|nr:PLP-dependent aminotransferase family protein [Candidatus Poribacteria bacterium]